MISDNKLIGYCLIAIAVGTALSIFLQYSFIVGMFLLPVGVYYVLMEKEEKTIYKVTSSHD